MSTQFGRNMKITLGESQREPFTRMMTEVFASTSADPMPAVRIFAMPCGFSLAAQFVSDEAALDRDAYFIAPWLEFLVPDVAAATEKLLAVGATTFEYVDTSHTYFRAPGGLVFRLAAVD